MNDMRHPSWRRLALIQRGLFVLLLGGIFLLLVEIRFEHSAVMGEKWQSWIPCVYLPVLVVLMPIGIMFVERFGRHLLIALFSGLIIVGTLGFWFHAKGKPVQKVAEIVARDFSAPGHLKEQSDEDSAPPVLAPLALVGLASIGVLVCFLGPKNGK